jgi:nucleoside-diphosphate-sugar epimerase
MNKKILILGGSGYIGTVLINEILKKRIKVINIDNHLFGDEIHNQYYIKDIDKNYEFINSNISEIEKFDKKLDGISDVIILAAIVGDPLSKKYPELTKKINEKYIIKCLHYLNKKDVDRVIFVSTCSNYGLIKDNEVADESFALNPLSIYAKSKVNIENYIQSQKNIFNFSPVILRFATAFGLSPRMRFDLTVNEFSIDLFFKKTLEVYDAETWRPYFHTKDFANTILRIIDIDKKLLKNEIFNVGVDDNNATKNDILKIIGDFADINKVKILTKGKDKRNYKVSFKKINQLLKLNDFMSIKDGVSEIYNEFKLGKFDNYIDSKHLYGNYTIKS